jgi:hypothetical protein
MFGFRLFYRKTERFAVLPDKRALEHPRAIAYKLPSGAEAGEDEQWKVFELESEQGIGKAMVCLEKA